jgi:hypothetical protein
MKRILLATFITLILFSFRVSAAGIVYRENIGQVTTSFSIFKTAQVFRPASPNITMVELQRDIQIRGVPDDIPVTIGLYAVDENYLPTGEPIAEASGEANKDTLTVMVPLKATGLDISKYYALVFISGSDNNNLWRLGLTPKATDWDVNEKCMYSLNGTWTIHSKLTFWFRVFSSAEPKGVLAFPNPLFGEGGARIAFKLDEIREFGIYIYDELSNMVWDTHISPVEVGYNEVYWDGSDKTGNIVPAGIYTCVIGKLDKDMSIPVLCGTIVKGR